MIDQDLPQALRTAIDSAAEPISAKEARLRAGTPSRSPRVARGGDPFRHRSRLAVTLVGVAALAVVLALITAVLQGGSSGRHSGDASSPPTALSMHVVDSTGSPFASVGAGAQSGNLECITANVCYAAENSPTAPDGWNIERTADGGRAWKPVGALPDHKLLAWPLSCPTSTDCTGSVSLLANENASTQGPEVAWTTSGGTQWRIESISVPSELHGAAIDQLSCATALRCVVHILESGEGPAESGTFLSTGDGGMTWTMARLVPQAAEQSLWTLKCDADGRCIGLVPAGSVSDPSSETIEALRSDDYGRTWTVASFHVAAGPGTLLMSCGDALHCLIAYNANNGTRVGVATTTDAGESWRVTVEPTSWPNTAISVSCASSLDCFISVADATRGGYGNPVIEATHNGGSDWTALSLPPVGSSSPVAIVYPLSCPVPTGCIGVAATAQEFDAPPTPLEPGRVPPKEPRVIVSNLPESD